MEPGVSMARRLALLGASLVMLGLLTGWISGALTNPRMGLSAHLEGLMNGTLMLALAGCWGHVHLPARQERLCFGLFAFGTLSNWLATFLAALWGAGSGSMPLTGAGHRAEPWQEVLVFTLLITLSVAMMAGFYLVIRGLRAPRAPKA